MLWIACSLAFALLGADQDGATNEPSAPAAQAEVAGCQWEATSRNFKVRNYHPSHDARQVAQYCEKWRSKLQKYWIAAERDAWTAKCEVVVHSGINSYLAVIGPGGRQTYGSSLIQFGDSKQVARRLIDFRGDSPQGIAAVPHEMTHVVLADLLEGRQPPRWADEGMAILADTREKQLLHERDLTQALAVRTAFRVGDLMSTESYPHPSRIAAFYGQSASLTACLAKRDDPAKFVEFLRRSLDDGYDKALRDVYHLESVAQLERHWHEQRTAWQSGYHGVRLAIDEAASSAAAAE